MAHPGTILIVDDEEDLRNLLDLAARREGFDTVVASSGTQALDILKTLRPQLVVLDLMMPDLSGTEVCRRIRATPEIAATPIIMLTARGEEIDRVVGFEVGADDYVVKSQFSVREFIAWSAEELGITLRFEGAGVEEVGVVAAVTVSGFVGPVMV